MDICIEPKTSEYYLLTSAALAELNGLKAREPDYAFEADNRHRLALFDMEFGRDHFTIDTGNYYMVVGGGMYTTRDVYGNPRFIIHFLDLVHEDHPGDHEDKMESER